MKIYKKYLIMCLCMLTLCTACNRIEGDKQLSNTDYSEPIVTPKEENSETKISSDDMLATINAITVAPRPMGSAQEKKVSSTLLDKFTKMGYDSSFQVFDYNLNQISDNKMFQPQVYFSCTIVEGKKDGSSQNIIAIKKSNINNAPVLVVSAHYDSEVDSVGANDNASGVAVVMETARILQKVTLPFDIHFVLFSGEEEFMFGSRVYLRDMNQQLKERIKGNLNIDSVGFKSEQGYQAVTFAEFPTGKPIDTTSTQYISPNTMTNLLTSNSKVEICSLMGSDHYSFFRAGIPSATLAQKMDDAMENIINSPNDTTDKIDPNRLVEATELVVDAINKLKNTGL